MGADEQVGEDEVPRVHRGWKALRKSIVAVAPSEEADSQARFQKVVNTAGQNQQKGPLNQQLWQASRNGDYEKVALLLFGDNQQSQKRKADAEDIMFLAEKREHAKLQSKPQSQGEAPNRKTWTPSNSAGLKLPPTRSNTVSTSASSQTTPAQPQDKKVSGGTKQEEAAHRVHAKSEKTTEQDGGTGGDAGKIQDVSADNIQEAIRRLMQDPLPVHVDWEMQHDNKDWSAHDQACKALNFKNRYFTSQALHAAVAPHDTTENTTENAVEKTTSEVVRTATLKREEEKEGEEKNRRKIVHLLLLARADPSAVAKAPPVSSQAASASPLRASAAASSHLLRASSTSSLSSSSSREVTAMHMASAYGDEEIIRMLVQFRADVDVQAKNRGEAYYAPLHEAVWFGQRTVVRTLVELRASIVSPNYKGYTPLHLAAHLGNEDMAAAILVLHDGHDLLGKKDKNQLTPLDVALQSARFPPRKLHLFTHNLAVRDKAQAFLKVAHGCPNVAPELLFNDTAASQIFEQRSISNAWRRHLQEAAEDRVITAQKLAELIDAAPTAAAHLVDALTAVPPVKDCKHHPLPSIADLPLSGESCRMACAYVPDAVWEWHTDIESAPSWHADLAPTNVKHGQEVEIKILKLPGVLNLDLMHALAVTREQVVFSKMAIHAVLRCAWKKTRWIHSMELLIQSTAMICMVLWVICPNLGTTWEKVLWCVVASEACSEVLLLVWMNQRCFTLLGFTKWRKWVLGILLRAVLACMNLCLTIEISTTWRPQPGDIVFAMSSLLHWVHFLWELRTFRVTGKRLLPMMKALMLLGGMLVVLVFLTIGFAHAFWAMEGDILKVWDLFSVVKLLFTGEVDGGIDPLELTAPDGERLFMCILTNGAIIIFVVCFVNLFIAVLSENYQAEQERLIYTLFSERAHVCCNVFLAPRVGESVLRAVKMQEVYTEKQVTFAFVGAFLAAFLGWLGLMYLMLNETLPEIIAVLVASASTLSLQSWVRGWLLCDVTTDCHLWVCHEKPFEESKLLVHEDCENLEVQGRIARLRIYIRDQIKEVGKSLKLFKDFAVKRHKEQEGLIVEVFETLDQMRDHLGLPKCTSSKLAARLASKSKEGSSSPSRQKKIAAAPDATLAKAGSSASVTDCEGHEKDKVATETGQAEAAGSDHEHRPGPGSESSTLNSTLAAFELPDAPSFIATIEDQNRAINELRSTVQSLRDDLANREQELQKTHKEITCLREEGQQLRDLVKQVLGRFDDAIMAAATGREILAAAQHHARELH